MIDPAEFGKHIGQLIKEATAPLLKRIDQLEQQLAVPAPTAAEIAGLVDLEAIAKRVQLPEVRNGKDADEVDLDALAKAAAALVVLPEVRNGKDADEVDLDALAKAAAALVVLPELTVPTVAEIIAQIPVPEAKHGKDADMDVLKGHLDTLVKAIKIPEPKAVPSVEEVAATFERRFSDLTLSWERQARDTFEKAADRMPKPKDGRDAIQLDGFDLSLSEDDRTVIVKMQAGDTLVEKSIKIAAVLDRGVFQTGGEYEKGDGVSYGGSFWIANCNEPKGVPGTGETDWRCAVKKGRDGKDLRDSSATVDVSKGVSIR